MDFAEQNFAAAGGSGTLELGGETYLIAPPDSHDFATLLKYLRDQVKNPIKAIAEDLKYLPPHLHEAAVSAAVKVKLTGGSLDPMALGEQLLEPAACSFFVWLLARKNQPNVKLEMVRKHVTPENVIDVLAKLHEATGLKAADEGKATGRPG